MKMAEIIDRKDTSQVDAENAFRGIQRIMHNTGMSLAEVMGQQASAGDEGLRRDRDHYKRAYERAARDLATRMGPANEARSMAADEFAEGVGQIIRAILRGHRYMSTDAIAAELTRRGIQTRQGGRVWTRMQVHRVIQRTGIQL